LPTYAANFLLATLLPAGHSKVEVIAQIKAALDRETEQAR
jgi:hypothetical protein